MTKQEEITEAEYELQWLEAKIELACLRYEFGIGEDDDRTGRGASI